LESTFVAVGLDSTGHVRRFLNELRKVRKRAGKVRDRDVLTADALSVNQDGEQYCLVELVEYLGAGRKKYAKKLGLVVERTGKQLRRDLKRSFRSLEKLLRHAANDPADSDAVPMTMAKAIKLSSDLNIVSSFNRNNLHSYRIKVKELRNVLQLAKKTGDQEFVERLGEVKDAIGEWHDWEELTAIAAQSIHHGKLCNLVKQLKATSNAKYERALFAASRFRRDYLKSPLPKHGSRHTQVAPFSAPILRATSAIAQR